MGAIASNSYSRTALVSKMKPLFKPLPLLCLSIALLLSFLLRPVVAASLIDSRVNQLEFQVRSLQTQVSQIQSQSPRPAGTSSRPVQTNESYIPGDPTLDEQFDNLAILVIELKQRVNALEQQAGQ